MTMTGHWARCISHILSHTRDDYDSNLLIKCHICNEPSHVTHVMTTNLVIIGHTCDDYDSNLLWQVPVSLILFDNHIEPHPIDTCDTCDSSLQVSMDFFGQWYWATSDSHMWINCIICVSKLCHLWQIPLKMLHLRDPPNREFEPQIPQYLAVQIHVENLVQFEFVPRNLSLSIR